MELQQTDLIEVMHCKNCKHLIEKDGKLYCNQRCNPEKSLEKQETHLEDSCSMFEAGKNQVNNQAREIFEKMKACLKEYLDMKDEYATLIPVWIMGTWIHNSFITYPYLFINAMKGTAKTRTLKLISALENGGEYVMSLTEAVMFRQNNPLGIDEFENIGHKDKGALRELLNAAYKKGGKVKRVKKKNTLQGEERVIETFDPYRPIHMANIWGMEEVLGDRCITIFLEKSQDKGVTKLMEDFDFFPPVLEVKNLMRTFSVVMCSVVTSGEMYVEWHNYIKSKYTPNYIIHKTTLNYTKLHTTFFDKIDAANIEGRNLELFFPLFLVAREIGNDVLDEMVRIAKEITEERRVEEITESKDVMMFEFISKQSSGEFYRIKELTTLFRNFVHDDEGENPWLNEKWVGRSLRRLQLIGKKRRTSEGIEVLLDVEKAKQKLEMFK